MNPLVKYTIPVNYAKITQQQKYTFVKKSFVREWRFVNSSRQKDDEF